MMETSPPFKTFHGVRFVLFGFDPINEQKIRCKLVDCGGVEVGQYSQSCTHVIVDKIVYDDPICVAARKDGKTLVTGLWVDHSYDIGMPVDPTSIMYRPLKDLNGIPGAKSLIMCLTGYQRQDRDDIMTMVALMGAQFSKPLVANKITHLICYKFEGEKYELAKKLTKIKLVNHLWLEDCLRDWEILPEANYNKSGYELEVMEAEAKDSEEEAENTSMKQSGVQYVQKSPWVMKSRMPEAYEVAKLEGLATNVLPVSPVTEVSLNTYNAKEKLSASQMENGSDHASNFNNVYIHKTLDLQDVEGFRVATFGELPNSHYRTPDGKNVRNDSTSNLRSAERSPHSDSGKFSAKSNSTKTPTRLGEMSSNVSGSSKVPLVELKVSDDLCFSSIKVEQAKNRLDSDCGEAPQTGINADHGEESNDILPQKRTMDGPFSSSKSHKISNDARSCSTSLLESDRTPGVLRTNDLHETINGHLTFSNDRNSPGGSANLNTAERLHASDVTKNSSSFAKLSSFDLPLSKNETPNSGQDENANKKTSPSDQDFKMSSFFDMPDIVPAKVTDVVAEMGGSHNHQQGIEGSAPGNRNLETKNSNSNSDVNLVGNVDLVSKPQRKKMVAKKTLGSRTKLASTTNRKGSIYLNKSMPQNDDSICSRRDNEKSPCAKTVDVSSPSMPQNDDSICSRGDNEKSPCAKIVDVSSPTENSEALKDLTEKDAADSGDNMRETKVMDDETEAPEEKVDEVLEKIFDEEMADVDKLTNKTDTMIEEKLEYVQHISNEWKASGNGNTIASKEDRKATESDDGISGKTSALAESHLKGDNAKKKKNKGKSFAVGKTKVKKVPEIVDIMKSKVCSVREETCNENNEVIEMEKEERASCPAGTSKNHNVPKKKLDDNMEVEKENRPIVNAKQNRTKTQKHVEKLAVKSNISPTKTNKKSAKISPSSSRLVSEVPNSVKTEPAWFVLSGHRLQRKEFQQVIRRLKGRLCRDSHQWSYQATHFIAPDPIRRTEKFFAAAASGRWILKTEYLTASSKEGRFLAEEPYEWYKNGLSEDGAINLEAPRKWRLLRERTGHGAFYGMNIIVYGECIAPPLDTLKRVVKAGDGTILATSPPYTRFLDSGVDFAIVSAGMPRVDMWVQEFLKHEIPCVVTDYLVEYVCKPGYSLERHVLHNTHAWAEKSFAKVQSRAEDVVGDLIQPPDDNSNKNSEEESKEEDIPCEVCGSGVRGEVMLICGNEDGSLGCGVGTHIDCCDPPFEEVPEDDWFCPKCCTSNSKSNNSTTSTKKSKKGTSALHS